MTTGNTRPRRRRRVAIAAAAAGGLLLGASVAYAALGGTITNINNVTGLATGSASSCQTSAMNFSFTDPSWDATAQEFISDTLNYADFAAACVTNGASLTVVVVSGGSEFANATVTPSSATGSVALDTAMDVDQVAAAQVNYLVNG